MSHVKGTLPQIRIDEAILVAYTMPAQITKSASITERETVIFRILPRHLLKRLQSVNVDLDFHLRKCLRTLILGKLYFVKYPLQKWKGVFEDILRGVDVKYQEFACDVLRHKEEHEGDVHKFAQKYKLDEVTCKTLLDERYLMERFKVRVIAIPIKLGSELKFDAISGEEVRKIEERVRKGIDEQYRALLNEKLGSFFQMLAKETGRLAKGRMTKTQTLAKLSNLYEEAATALAITDDKRYLPTFELIEEFLNSVAARRERHRRASDRRVAAEIVAETLRVTSSIRERARPVLDDFKTLVIDEIERIPVKRVRDKSLKELVASIKL